MNTRSACAVPLAGDRRESFFAAQNRCRKGAWRWRAVMTVVVFAITLVISLLLAPVTFALFGVVVDLVNLARPAPDVLGALGRLIDTVINTHHVLPIPHLVKLAVLAALPGFAVLVVIWLRLGLVVDRSNFQAVHVALRLRDPRPGDVEEHQLVDVVQEIAIAAERPPPRLQLLDTEACNLGLLGDGKHAVLVVTRGLLDHLDRAQTQALIGQAIAALGNGDGRLAERMLHLDLMIGLLSLLSQTPIDKTARAAVRPILRLRPGAGALNALLGALGGSAADSDDDDSSSTDSASSWRDWLLLPWMGSMLVGILIVPISVMLFVAPLNGLIWRRRRLLADATAVQFTRDPEALAEAYSTLSERSSSLGVRMRWLGNLFLLDTGSASNLRLGSPYPRYRRRMARLHAMGASVELPARQGAPLWVWLVGLPFGIVIVGLLGAVVVMGAGLSLALNALFLALPTALIHVALRLLGH